MILGLALSGVSYAVLPLLGHTLPLVLAALFVVFFTVEFAIVTAVSLCTEVLPGVRATMMSGYTAARFRAGSWSVDWRASLDGWRD